MTIFKLPENSDKRNLKIFVLNPKGRIIYSAPVPKKSKKIKDEDLALIDEIQ